MKLPFSRIARARTVAELEKIVATVCTHYGIDGSLPLGDLIDEAYLNGHPDLAEFFEKAENQLAEIDR